MRNKFNLRASHVLGCTASLFLLLSISLNGYSAQDATEKSSKDAGITTLNETYTYISEGRTDPFKPFISPKAATITGQDPNEIVDEGVQLTGMQLFEPGQLALVGIMSSGAGEIALVEDQTRKGYILKLGNPIGKRGVVTRIDKQQVIITETARTRAGKEINSTVIMRLNKEGAK